MQLYQLGQMDVVECLVPTRSACPLEDSLGCGVLLVLCCSPSVNTAMVSYRQGCVLLPAFVVVFLFFPSGSVFSFSACNKKDRVSLVTLFVFFLYCKQPKRSPGIEVTVNTPYLLDIKRSTPNLATPLSAEIEDPTRGERREILT